MGRSPNRAVSTHTTIHVASRCTGFDFEFDDDIEQQEQEQECRVRTTISDLAGLLDGQCHGWCHTISGFTAIGAPATGYGLVIFSCRRRHSGNTDRLSDLARRTSRRCPQPGGQVDLSNVAPTPALSRYRWDVSRTSHRGTSRRRLCEKFVQCVKNNSNNNSSNNKHGR